MLYIEGSTDLSILRAFARRLNHEGAVKAPFIHAVENRPASVRSHFHALKEALPALRGIALFDRIPRPDIVTVECLIWNRREIENYLCSQATLETFATAAAAQSTPGPLFSQAEAERRLSVMRTSISEVKSALTTLGKGSPWGTDIKASDEFLTPLFESYFNKLEIPNLMAKRSFYELAEHVPDNEIDPGDQRETGCYRASRGWRGAFRISEVIAARSVRVSSCAAARPPRPDFDHAVGSGLAVAGGEVARHRQRRVQVVHQAVPVCRILLRHVVAGQRRAAETQAGVLFRRFSKPTQVFCKVLDRVVADADEAGRDRCRLDLRQSQRRLLPRIVEQGGQQPVRVQPVALTFRFRHHPPGRSRVVEQPSVGVVQPAVDPVGR